MVLRWLDTTGSRSTAIYRFKASSYFLFLKQLIKYRKKSKKCELLALTEAENAGWMYGLAMPFYMDRQLSQGLQSAYCRAVIVD